MIPQEFNEAAADEYTKTGVRVADPDWPWYVKFRKYVLQLMNVVDLLAIVPFYLEYLASTGSSIAIIRILRLARMLRIFKASKYNEGTSLLLNTLTRSFSALTLLFFFTAIGVVLFGSLIYFMEAGSFKVTEEYPDEEEETPFTSILVSCYWVIVTATTVGFGDLYPTSAGGRLVACVCMYCGLLVLALPITVVGSNFASVYEEKEELRELEKQLQEAQQVTEA
ncbi:KCNA1, partial [Symbiodinium microadriaticum]